jgi:hypothetical protein
MVNKYGKKWVGDYASWMEKQRARKVASESDPTNLSALSFSGEKANANWNNPSPYTKSGEIGRSVFTLNILMLPLSDMVSAFYLGEGEVYRMEDREEDSNPIGKSIVSTPWYRDLIIRIVKEIETSPYFIKNRELKRIFPSPSFSEKKDHDTWNALETSILKKFYLYDPYSRKRMFPASVVSSKQWKNLRFDPCFSDTVWRLMWPKTDLLNSTLDDSHDDSAKIYRSLILDALIPGMHPRVPSFYNVHKNEWLTNWKKNLKEKILERIISKKLKMNTASEWNEIKKTYRNISERDPILSESNLDSMVSKYDGKGGWYFAMVKRWNDLHPNRDYTATKKIDNGHANHPSYSTEPVIEEIKTDDVDKKDDSMVLTSYDIDDVAEESVPPAMRKTSGGKNLSLLIDAFDSDPWWEYGKDHDDSKRFFVIQQIYKRIADSIMTWMHDKKASHLRSLVRNTLRTGKTFDSEESEEKEDEDSSVLPHEEVPFLRIKDSADDVADAARTGLESAMPVLSIREGEDDMEDGYDEEYDIGTKLALKDELSRYLTECERIPVVKPDGIVISHWGKNLLDIENAPSYAREFKRLHLLNDEEDKKSSNTNSRESSMPELIPRSSAFQNFEMEINGRIFVPPKSLFEPKKKSNYSIESKAFHGIKRPTRRNKNIDHANIKDKYAFSDYKDDTLALNDAILYSARGLQDEIVVDDVLSDDLKIDASIFSDIKRKFKDKITGKKPSQAEKDRRKLADAEKNKAKNDAKQAIAAAKSKLAEGNIKEMTDKQEADASAAATVAPIKNKIIQGASTLSSPSQTKKESGLERDELPPLFDVPKSKIDNDLNKRAPLFDVSAENIDRKRDNLPPLFDVKNKMESPKVDDEDSDSDEDDLNEDSDTFSEEDEEKEGSSDYDEDEKDYIGKKHSSSSSSIDMKKATHSSVEDKTKSEPGKLDSPILVAASVEHIKNTQELEERAMKFKSLDSLQLLQKLSKKVSNANTIIVPSPETLSPERTASAVWNKPLVRSITSSLIHSATSSKDGNFLQNDNFKADLIGSKLNFKEFSIENESIQKEKETSIKNVVYLDGVYYIFTEK